MLFLQGVTVTFGSRSLFDDLTWELGEPGVYLILGANGSGKTVLLDVVGGRRAPSKGTVMMGSVPVYGLFGPDLPRIEYLRREAVGEDIGTLWSVYTHRLRQGGGRWAPREMLEHFHLPWDEAEMRRRRVSGLPQGQLLEFELLCAASAMPRYLLVDDYFSRFSFNTCERVASNLQTWQRLGEGTALVTSSRFFGFMDVFTDVFFLEKGKLVSIYPRTVARNESSRVAVDEAEKGGSGQVLVVCGEYFYRHSRVQADNPHLILRAVLENALLIDIKSSLDEALNHLRGLGIDIVSVEFTPRKGTSEYGRLRFF